MPNNAMNPRGTANQYQKMNIDESGRLSGPSYEGADVMEEAQRHLEELRLQKKKIDEERKKIEDFEIKKSQFSESQEELGRRMADAVDRLEQEIASMNQEVMELDHMRLGFHKDLKFLGGIHCEEWTPDSIDMQLGRAAEVMDHCETDFDDAVEHCSHMKHCKVLTRTKKSRHVLLTFKEFTTQFLQGLSFHIPLFILLVILYLIVSCGTGTPKI
ncbi:MAG: hypothetical protein RSB88_01880 [Akkermansia sp.]